MKGISKKSDYKNKNNRIIYLIIAFYDAYYKSERLKLYSYLNTAFQKEVPLNYFLIHSDYNINLGTLIEITNIRIEKYGLIAAEITVELNNKKRDVVITIIKDFGGWKIEGDSIYRGNYS